RVPKLRVTSAHRRPATWRPPPPGANRQNHGLPAALAAPAHPQPPHGRRRAFQAPRPAAAALLAAADRAHRDLGGVGDRAHGVMMTRTPKPARRRALTPLATSGDRWAVAIT